MNRSGRNRMRTVILCVFMASVMSIVGSAYGQETGRDALWGVPQPSHYRTISQPATSAASKHAPPSFTVSSQKPQPYAYGWFGQKSTQSWYRQFGHQQNFTQWTLR